jgi:hypothetical protein
LKTIPFTIDSKRNQIPRSKLNKGLRKTTEDGKISHGHGLVESA